MKNDRLSKQLMSRRTTLRLLGAAGATAVVGLAGGPILERLPEGRRGMASSTRAASCVVRPQLTEGPYFVDEKLNRSDIRTDPTTGAVRPGVLLLLNFNVTAVSGSSCVPLPNAYVDVWHCDALGTYSDVSGSGAGQKFLRGYQVTDSDGVAQFTTVYPGWYSGRAVHIHFKIRLFSGSQKTYEFTSQFFFPDSLNDQVYLQSPYSSKGNPDTPNSRDGIYNGGGSQLLLTPVVSGQGYSATLDIALEGITVTAPSGSPPQVTDAAVSGKLLYVMGENFDSGAKLLMDGVKQKKTFNDDANPTSMLIAKKSGKQIQPGQTVTLQVVNSDSTSSNEFSYTRPAA
jgi:protocatechuate 3,4-dioxygenase beta subunit